VRVCDGVLLIYHLTRVAYLAFSTVDFGNNKSDSLFAIACCLTAIALFALGAIKSRFSTETWWFSGLIVLGNGSLSAGAAFLIGYSLEQIVNTN
jgi:DNA damage-binding protein 1